VAVIAGLDTVFGGMRSVLESKFRADIFISGFFSNILIAFFLAWLGDQIGINLFVAAALVLGARMFTNLSLIRRILITQWQDARQKKRLEADQQV
jgi:small basic protein